MAEIREQAHAKINLALHVTGQRADGYHLLDTLVTFTEAGDSLTFRPASRDRFTLSGRFAPALEGADGADNLVLRARDGLRALLGEVAGPVHIHLEKNLPVSSGIGGGSADAAASLRGLMRLWDARPLAEALDRLALTLGADVPMCLVSRPLIARGIGEEIERIALPRLCLLLVNPLKPVSTPAIFRRLTTKDNPPLPAERALLQADPLGFLTGLRNDLQPPAEEIEPAIPLVIAALRTSGARLVRMSGSGATCFGLFDDRDTLQAAAAGLRKAHPDWFVAETESLP